jgi:hypothetical protein
VVEIPLSTHWDFLSTKLAAGGFKVEAMSQSPDEKNILRTQGYIIYTIAQVHEYSASVHNILSTLPEFDDEGDEEVREARQRGETPIYAETFDRQNHRTREGLTVSGTFPGLAILGDLIAVLLGSKLPFVIQPINPDLDRELEGNILEATIIGPCVVPEVMYGMVVKKAREYETVPTEFRFVQME